MKEDFYPVHYRRNGKEYVEQVSARISDQVRRVLTKEEFRDSIIHSLKKQINYDSTEGIIEKTFVEGIDD